LFCDDLNGEPLPTYVLLGGDLLLSRYAEVAAVALVPTGMDGVYLFPGDLDLAS